MTYQNFKKEVKANYPYGERRFYLSENEYIGMKHYFAIVQEEINKTNYYKVLASYSFAGNKFGIMCIGTHNLLSDAIKQVLKIIEC